MKPRHAARSEDVAGEPVEVRGRTLTPVARVAIGSRRRAVIGTKVESALLLRSVVARPLAVVDSTAHDTRIVAVRDETRQQLATMKCIGALLLGAALLLEVGRSMLERRTPDD